MTKCIHDDKNFNEKCKAIVDAGHWNIDAVGNFDPESLYGFIYEIEEKSSGRIYIGRKGFHNKTVKSRDWKNYNSSSADLKALIQEKGQESFIFRIIILCAGKSQLTYEEEKKQFENDVLRCRLPNGEKKYFNKTIGYKNFNGVEKQTERQKEILRDFHAGKPKSEIHRKNISNGRKGIKLTDEHKRNISKANIGNIQSSETKKKRQTSTQKLKWWNNGLISKRTEICPGLDWVPGRIGGFGKTQKETKAIES